MESINDSLQVLHMMSHKDNKLKNLEECENMKQTNNEDTKNEC